MLKKVAHMHNDSKIRIGEQSGYCDTGKILEKTFSMVLENSRLASGTEIPAGE